jgi:NAD(P)-dependent dehydrogenase (short-subunit alcohol dehydrogenase family)
MRIGVMGPQERKAGIDMMMRNLALEWGRYGIRANSIVPGPIAGTEGMKRLSSLDAKDAMISLIPMGRFGTVDDIGQTAAFLASPLASYITGCVVVCDGGSGLAGSARFNAGAEKMLQTMAGKA